MSAWETCPWCGADLRNHEVPHPEEGKHYLRTIGIVLPGVYDGVCLWKCPDCHRLWNRWEPEDGRRFELTRAYIDAHQPPPEPLLRAVPTTKED